MRHLLVTNDYPPKLGGIQNYLWELYRRLPPDDVCVLTRPHPGADVFDRRRRTASSGPASRSLFPSPGLLARYDRSPRSTGPSWSCSTPPCRSAPSLRTCRTATA